MFDYSKPRSGPLTLSDWDPASIQCPLFDAPGCLTAQQVQAVRAIYAAGPSVTKPTAAPEYLQ